MSSSTSGQGCAATMSESGITISMHADLLACTYGIRVNKNNKNNVITYYLHSFIRSFVRS